MKIVTTARVAVAAALATVMVGCMSMEEKLASEDPFWRDLGESEAVGFVLDGANPLEKRLEVVSKIANQQKLAKIVIAKRVAPEVKNEARKRIDEASALTAIALNAPEKNDQMDALRQITKNEDSRIEAAWIFAESKPSSDVPQTLLKELSDAGRAKFAKSFSAKIDAAAAANKEAEKLRRKYGDSMAKGKLKELKHVLKSLVMLAPCVEDENTITAILQRQDIADVKGTEYDFLTPLEGAYQKAAAERKAREAKAEAERKVREAQEFLASLTDKERVKLLTVGRLPKQGKTVVATEGAVSTVSPVSSGADARMGMRRMQTGQTGSSAEEVYKISRDNILKSIKDPELSKKMAQAEEKRRALREKLEAERKGREEAERQKAEALKGMREKAFDALVKAGILKEHDINQCGSADGDPVKKFKLAAEYLGKVSYYEGMGGIKKWMQSIELFKGTPELQQDLAEMLFDHAYSDFDDEQKLAELKKVIAVMPQSRVLEIFRSNITDKKVELKARAIAYGITDQKVLRDLLVNDDSWARPRTKNCDWQRRRNVHATLLANVKDAELADKIFCETRPTKNTDVITVGNILSLIDRISEAKRKELTDRAFARAEEAKKSTVVVKQYYVGMSYLDYELVNFSNGDLSASGLSRFDDGVSRKMTHIGFTKENRIKKLDITQSNVIAACHQFAEKYGKVPDGKDVSGKTDVVAAIRTKEAFSDSAPGGTEYSSNGVWKWIDYVHDVQAEIGTNSGDLVLCKAVVEGEFNHKNVKKEQQAAVLDAFADLASDDDDKDMGPDQGLEPVGK